MKKTVEEKAEIAKQKIDSKLQKQRQKEEKSAAKKEASANKKTAKKEAQQQKKAAKQQINSEKKDLKKQQKEAKKEAVQLKKQQKQEAKNKIKELKAKAKQGKVTEPKTEAPKEKKKEKKPAKPAKKGKKGEEENASSGNGKKKLFIGLLALVFAGGGVVGFLHFRGGDKEENTDPYIEAYVLDDDFVTSIPKFLEQSETRALPEITVEETPENKQVIYDYTELKGAAKEVKDYITFLTTEKEFVPMFDFNLDAPAGYISVGTASVEEGKTLKLDIDYTDTDYKVVVSKTIEELPKPKKEDDGTDGSRDGALNYLTGVPAETLGLSKPVGEYKAIYDPGQSTVGDRTCYGISLYELGRAGTNEFVGKFFVATNQSSVFRYDSAEDTYIEVVSKASKKKEEAKPETTETELAEGAEEKEKAENTKEEKEEDEKEKDTKEETKDKETKEEEETEDKEAKEEDKKKEHQKGQKPEREETEDKKTKAKAERP